MNERKLKIVSSNNVEIFRHLGAVESTSTTIEHQIGADVEELWELASKEKPLLAILDSELPSGSGIELCRRIKDSDELRATHVILLHGSVMTSADVARIAESRCDDVLSLPIHAEDFYTHIAQVTGVSLRRTHRVPIDVRAAIVTGEAEIDGKVINVSPTGMGMKVDRPIETGSAKIRLKLGDETPADITAQVVWCHPTQKGHAVGLRFIGVPATAKALLMRLSMFEVSVDEATGVHTVRVQGGFDERVDFEPLKAGLEGARTVDFTLQGVNYLSSSGVRSWCLFLEAFPDDVTYGFRNCSVAFAAQAAMVPMVIGRGHVHSVQAPYFCETCDREETRLVETALVERGPSKTPPPLHCHLCNQPLLFDDLPERYFAFLGE